MISLGVSFISFIIMDSQCTASSLPPACAQALITELIVILLGVRFLPIISWSSNVALSMFPSLDIASMILLYVIASGLHAFSSLSSFSNHAVASPISSNLLHWAIILLYCCNLAGPSWADNKPSCIDARIRCVSSLFPLATRAEAILMDCLVSPFTSRIQYPVSLDNVSAMTK